LSGSNQEGLVPATGEPRPLTGFSRRFGDLRVRPKLMVLHNLFFLVLTLGVYFSIMPLVESRLAAARAREVSLIWNTFSTVTPDSGEHELRFYELTADTGDALGLPREAQRWMREYPGRIWQREPVSEHIYKLAPGSRDRFYRLRLPLAFYDGLLMSARLALFAALGIVYVLAVLLLELVIMPRYVYQPLRLMLQADAATRRGDRDQELVPGEYIPGDEIGQIMQSRNEVVTMLRHQEDVLEEALHRLEATANDLRVKNEQLEAAKRNLEAQDRLVSLGLLSASVAHEMNTPLAVLHGSIEKLLETLPDRATQGRLVRMRRVTERLRKISTGLLDFARVRQREMSPVGLRGLIEESWQLVAIDERASAISFHNEVPPVVQAMGNADQLVQVFVNLLRNALHAVGAAGRICVMASPAWLGSRRAVTVTVEDNGPGIPPEVLPEIFEVFVTTRLDAHGTGLGLAVAEGIVSQHDGTISAANCPGGGARLMVTLPCPEDKDPAKEAS
jgi:signal transduction histidine kinase